jgi:methyl-accepting chemotaxis protein
MPGAGMDDEKLRAITDYMSASPEALERTQALREQVHQILNDEFIVVATDLGQLRRILADAAEKLSGTFRVVTASSEELRTTIATVKGTADAEVLSRISEIAGEMTSTTGITIQSLQFEDMATQLLQHVDRKLSVLARLARDMAVINPTMPSVPTLLRTGELDELFARLAGYRTELAVTTRKVVQQESLESGEIELF